ncbi:MAG: AAA15 family ATPase/GTPase [Arenicella sp.]|jgi:AAA15 family ATPase/GTPase
MFIFVENLHRNKYLGMIIEFSVSNFRSIREKQVFSMQAYGSKSKPNNVSEVLLDSEETLRLVKSAGIYGGNSFGKSNVLHALHTFRRLIATSADYKVGTEIKEYDPFLFNIDSRHAPTTFELTFVGPNNQKYKYVVSFDKKNIISEDLSYYPLKQSRNIFRREPENNELIHQARIDKNIKGKKSYDVYHNQLMLSKFGGGTTHSFIAPIYIYLTEKIDIWNIDSLKIHLLKEKIIHDLKDQENSLFFSRLEKLIRIADTKISSLVLSKVSEGNLDSPEHIRKDRFKNSPRLYAKHEVYDSLGQTHNPYDLPFDEESTGTNFLFALGGLILQVLAKGGVIIFDEFDTSLNPALSRVLVQLFHYPETNPKNAQLIFVSHEPHILDKNRMRADQIWFADKNERGETEIYSASQFEGIREDIPFDSWYLAGKFGAMPEIDESALLELFNEEVPAK